jgi:putative transposase
MDRFKSPRIQDDAYMLRAMTYGDLNGVRCKRDKHPEDAKWSSYAHYAYGRDDPLITPSPSYLTIGETPEERQRAYRDMVQELMRRDRINISNTCFIGDPDWVTQRYEILREEMRAIIERRRSPKVPGAPSDPP